MGAGYLMMMTGPQKQNKEKQKTFRPIIINKYLIGHPGTDIEVGV